MNNRGMALLTGLVLLAAISLLALSAASGTVLQRNLATNYQENERALENALIAANEALSWLNHRAVSERQRSCFFGCLLPIGIHSAGELPDQPEFESGTWWRNNAYRAGYDPETTRSHGTADNGIDPAHWLIEEIHYAETGDAWATGQAEGVAYYRILGRGTGYNARTVAVVELITARPWEGEFEMGNYPPDGPDKAFCQQFGNRYDCGKLSWRQRR